MKPIVLVVDDEPLIRWSLSEAFIEQGYPVRVAGSGAEARAVADDCADAPMVVLLDLRLPDVADLSLLEAIRRRCPRAPVIVMTAHGTADDSRRAFALGAYRFIDKPFDVPTLVGLVGEAWASANAH